MAGAPAYRYDRSYAAQPSRYAESSPAFEVVPGRRHVANPPLSDGAIVAIKVFVACLVVFCVVGFLRVVLASAAYGIASQSADLSSDIADARTASESLAVQESLLSSPGNVRTQADKLGMVAATSSESITLAVDPVVVDSEGHLSFHDGAERLASQG